MLLIINTEQHLLSLAHYSTVRPVNIALTSYLGSKENNFLMCGSVRPWWQPNDFIDLNENSKNVSWAKNLGRIHSWGEIAPITGEPRSLCVGSASQPFCFYRSALSFSRFTLEYARLVFNSFVLLEISDK